MRSSRSSASVSPPIRPSWTSSPACSADSSIDIQTGALLGRYIAEERDSGRLFQACYAQLCAEEADTSGAGGADGAALARIEKLLEQVVARLPG